jgi:hypothetical protein
VLPGSHEAPLPIEPKITVLWENFNFEIFYCINFADSAIFFANFGEKDSGTANKILPLLRFIFC